MTDLTCLHCGAVATRNNWAQKFCSPQCRGQANYHLKKRDGRYEAFKTKARESYVPRPPREPKPPRLCSSDGCERTVHGHGMCKMHYKRWATEQGLNKPGQWTDLRRSNYHARRARLNGARNSDRVMLADIITRDGLACASCGYTVDLDLAWPDPMSKSIDHTLAVSRGGTHTLDNCTLMHLRCNASKGNRSTSSAAPLTAS